MNNEDNTTPPSDLKLHINNLLWANLPPDTTLHDAEELSLKFYYKILEVWRERNNREDRETPATGASTQVATINREAFMRP